MSLEQYYLIMVKVPNGAPGPAVILTPGEMNRNIDTLIIAPITTSSIQHYTSRIPVEISGRKGFIAVDQIRSISKKRIIKEHIRLSDREVEELKRVISQVLL